MHQFSRRLNCYDYIDLKGGQCKPFIAPFAVFLNENNENYVEPDISVICDPDWVIEIVSPSSRRMDYSIKLFRYRSAGVREYWIVDVTKNLILKYDFIKDDSEQYTFQENVKANIYEDLHIDFNEISKDFPLT